MPILKYLLIALVLIWLFYSPALRGIRGGSKGPKPSDKPNKPPATEAMVQCAHCGVHLPNGEAYKDPHGRAFCSAAHLQAGPARR
jgi:uncharacterized protein